MKTLVQKSKKEYHIIAIKYHIKYIIIQGVFFFFFSNFVLLKIYFKDFNGKKIFESSEVFF
jgi:hypothetical protein